MSVYEINSSGIIIIYLYNKYGKWQYCFFMLFIIKFYSTVTYVSLLKVGARYIFVDCTSVSIIGVLYYIIHIMLAESKKFHLKK